jgi:hypothetical protein
MGWYIDDIEIVTKVPQFTGDFETGWGDWSANRGVWQIGPPAAGPGACFSGTNCAGTILDGDYPAYTASSLVSATVTLDTVTGPATLHLRFQNWFSYSSYDSGQVYVSVWDSAASSWLDPIPEGTAVTSTSGGWSLKDVDLTAYAGETVRIMFYHTATRSPNSSYISESTGWYIDDIVFEVIP